MSPHTKNVIEAFMKGKITDLNDCDCIGECEKCPAGPTCEFLGGSSIDVFIIKYNKLILPELKQYYPELLV